MLVPRRRTEYNAGIKEEERKGRCHQGRKEKKRTLALKEEKSRGGH